jgi:2-polyprenyl-3-methyl-5-hydroxy-6-metoxy-1,4-benzoquinol methylase
MLHASPIFGVLGKGVIIVALGILGYISGGAREVDMDNERNRVCPVGLAASLESKVRRWLQDPHKILLPFVREGMTVLDIGCGPGFFSTELAKMVGGTGKVVAADLQDGMLRKLSLKIRGTELEERIHLVKCERDEINILEKIDFGLAFWIVHEVPNKQSFFKQLKAILNKKARILLVEPKLFHVSRKEFEATSALAEHAGFVVSRGPRLLLCWSAVLENAEAELKS